MRHFALEQQTGDSPVGGQQQQPFGILVEPSNGMCTLREIKIEMAQKPDFMGTHKL
jgi:hypothetical protein